VSAKTQVSLRNRVLRTALGALLGFGIVIVGLLALTIGPIMQQAQIDGMKQQAHKAVMLDGNVASDQLAEAITSPGTSVVISNSDEPNETVVPSELTIQSDADVTTLEVLLPKSNLTLTIAASNSQSSLVLIQILGVGIPSILLLSIVLYVLLSRAMTRALKPLDELTGLARKIATGERGGRLESNNETELGRTALAMNEMLDNLEGSLALAQEAEQKVRQLNQDVAHEMRTPLASIIATADNQIRNSNLDEEDQKALVAIIREGRRAANIVSDLTMLEDSGLANQPTQIVSLDRLVDELVTKDVPANINIEISTVPTPVEADPNRIEQVIRNLTQNAIRHASSKIKASCFAEKGSAVLVIEDDGRGIAQRDRKRIFDRFVRLDESRSRAHGGSGLGLSICKKIVESYKGQIRAEESLDLGGAKFIVTLPLAKD
jgi:two-component system OmpR family sensor kinase